MLLQPIEANAIFGIGFCFLSRRLYRAHFRQIHGFHQAVHSAAADVYAIFPCKAFGDFLRTQPLVTFDVQRKDFLADPSVFNISAGIFAITELVVSAPIDLQDPTKCSHSVLMAQRMDSG